MEPEFDSARDAILIASGSHFHCQTHMTARPLAERSPDPRYCRGCYELLLKEAELEARGRRPAWMPRVVKPISIPCPTDPTNNLTANSEERGSEDISRDISQKEQTIPHDVSLIPAYRIAAKQRGRPRILGAPMSRTTLWRRRREAMKQKEILI